MVFSSQLFLFVFMPVFFSLYYLVGDRSKNWLLLAGSLLFYAIGAGSTVLVLLASIVVNQFLAPRIERAEQPARWRLLAAGVTINLAGLAFYKYAEFLWRTLSDLGAAAGLPALPDAPSIPLPIGISFFTFQAVSYLIDVYRSDVPAAAGYSEFAVYHSLFPQLVAGPIVRYREIRDEMLARRIDVPELTEGAYRFCLGLGKKLIIADNVGTIADAIFGLPPEQLGAAQAWLGVLCYSLQIYFDFSGYSDMAIGLGRLLGFRFPENFDQPYRSQNVTEFWRRWHMTLSRWFRDYVYIPLGGNRRGGARTYFNLWTVFFLCGLWHGAGLTFIVWGLYHGSLLVLERLAVARWRWRPSGIPGIVATFILVSVGWVFFRSTSLDAAGHYLASMFLLGSATEPHQLSEYLTRDAVLYIGLGLAFSFGPFGGLLAPRFDRARVLAAQLTFSIVCLVYSLLMMAANTFNPFIYFRF